MEIGVMQGRLVPRYKQRYQAFPVGYWEAEFHIAREIGFQNIEFILDFELADENPLMSESGLERIKRVVGESGVGVRAICADYFMAAPFHSEHQAKSEKVLNQLIQSAARLGARDITIPCVDQSTLKTDADKKRLVKSVQKALPAAMDKKVFINFETDLGPKDFLELLERFDSPMIKVNYDIGNSASLGYDPVEELNAYGEYVSDLHIKDRALKGSSVKLGTGNAKFDTVFKLLKEKKFCGNITLQASRAQNYVEDLQLVREQLSFAREYVIKYLG